MKTTKTKKMSFVLTGMALASLLGSNLVKNGSLQALMENDIIHHIKAKIEAYNKHLPEDRLYLQTDKPFYEPGDNIWFSAMVRDGASLKASSKSDIIHVELLSPK
ncbi:MAG: hypothetical protein JNL60_14625, partial [Bacteroidia bacterium]|nr:hypothetical protein [Bacteroidia bacterium]